MSKVSILHPRVDSFVFLETFSLDLIHLGLLTLDQYVLAGTNLGAFSNDKMTSEMMFVCQGRIISGLPPKECGVWQFFLC